MTMTKFMQTLEKKVYDKLNQKAEERGISVQELIRAIIIPDWIKQNGVE